MDTLDCVVIGAGVIGLAVGRALALRGRSVLVLEAGNAIGTGVSSRSSEVLHAGLYYPAESLRARLCVSGNTQLVAFCSQHGVGYRLCGKLVVATDASQMQRLRALYEQGERNGVHGLKLLDAVATRALEPALRAYAALHVPSTGIVDSHALMLALAGSLQHAGGEIVLHTPVRQMRRSGAAMEIIAEDGTAVCANWVINAASLGAVPLARTCPQLDAAALPTAHYAKGRYCVLQGRAPFTRLVYPLPPPGGLGVHLTLDLAGQARFGPDVVWVDDPTDLQVEADCLPTFYAEVRRYWPDLPDGALQPGYAGMRPKIHGPEEPAADFRIDTPAHHGVPGLINLFGIESPGLTSCLALADYVAARVD